jgi:hypothetical protein
MREIASEQEHTFMKKQSMWIILGAVLLAEIIVYFVFVSPQGGEIEEKAGKLRLFVKKLNRYVKMGSKIPNMEAVRQHRENKKRLEDEHKKCIDFYKGQDGQLKRWFVEMDISDWKTQPTPAKFHSIYKDKLKGLRDRCKEKGIRITKKGDLDFTSDENAIASMYRRRAQAPVPSDTQPDEIMGGGFWETSQLNAQNLRTAQMQYWIQEAFVEALIYADGKRLVYVSFFKAAQPANLPKEPTIDEHFERIPVTVLVRIPYGSMGRMLQSLGTCGINMDLRSVTVTKLQLLTITTNPDPTIKDGMTYTQQQCNGVFPKVMDTLGGVNFGTQPIQRQNNLPDQDRLITEPAVLVEFSYSVMDMKPEK